MLKDFAGLEPDPRFAAFEKLMDAEADYLPMADILAKWDAIAEPLSKGIKALPEEFFAGDGPFPTPAGTTMGDFLAFILHHEAYHIGQVALLRRIVGHEGAIK